MPSSSGFVAVRNRLVDQTRRVAGMVNDIEIALREQSMAATDVAQKVEKISIQAEETSHASSRTSITAERLDGVSREM